MVVIKVGAATVETKVILINTTSEDQKTMAMNELTKISTISDILMDIKRNIINRTNMGTIATTVDLEVEAREGSKTIEIARMIEASREVTEITRVETVVTGISGIADKVITRVAAIETIIATSKSPNKKSSVRTRLTTIQTTDNSTVMTRSSSSKSSGRNNHLSSLRYISSRVNLLKRSTKQSTRMAQNSIKWTNELKAPKC